MTGGAGAGVAAAGARAQEIGGLGASRGRMEYAAARAMVRPAGNSGERTGGGRGAGVGGWGTVRDWEAAARSVVGAGARPGAEPGTPPAPLALPAPDGTPRTAAPEGAAPGTPGELPGPVRGRAPEAETEA